MKLNQLFLGLILLIFASCGAPKDPEKRIDYEFEQAEKELVFIASFTPLVCFKDEIDILDADLDAAQLDVLEACSKLIDKYNESLADIKPHNLESEAIKRFLDQTFTKPLNKLKKDVDATAKNIKETEEGGLMALFGGLKAIGSGVSLVVSVVKAKSAVTAFQDEFPKYYNDYVKSIGPKIKSFIEQARAIQSLPESKKAELKSHFISTMSDEFDAALEKAKVKEKTDCPVFEEERQKIFNKMKKLPTGKFWEDMSDFSLDSLYLSPEDIEFKK